MARPRQAGGEKCGIVCLMYCPDACSPKTPLRCTHRPRAKYLTKRLTRSRCCDCGIALPTTLLCHLPCTSHKEVLRHLYPPPLRRKPHTCSPAARPLA